MGDPQLARSEPENQAGAGLHPEKIFASNTGVCVEEPVRNGEIALNLGSGSIRWPGWVNVDGFNDRADVSCDLRKLTFPPDYVDRIAAIHVMEHFYQWEVIPMLREWKRVLVPGGKIILELPCMDKVFNHIMARMKKGENPSPGFSWLAIWGDPGKRDVSMCHKWGYFKGDMDKVLQEAGFENITHEEAKYHFPRRDMRVTATKPLTT